MPLEMHSSLFAPLVAAVIVLPSTLLGFGGSICSSTSIAKGLSTRLISLTHWRNRGGVGCALSGRGAFPPRGKGEGGLCLVWEGSLSYLVEREGLPYVGGEPLLPPRWTCSFLSDGCPSRFASGVYEAQEWTMCAAAHHT